MLKTACIRIIILAGLLVFAGAAVCRAEPEYRVTIDASPGVKEVLENNLDINVWKERGITDPDFFRFLYNKTSRDIKKIMGGLGYFSPDISQQLRVADNIYAAEFFVKEGAQAVVKSVDISFTGEIISQPPESKPEIAMLEKQWILGEGEPFSSESWERAKRRLLRELLVNSYPAARITKSSAVVDTDSSEVKISLEINSGPVFTLGELRVEGMERYPEWIVHNLNFIRPGSQHSRDRLLDLQSRIQQSGYFEFVDVRIEVDPGEPVNVPVRVHVRENPRRRIRFGIDISSDTGAGARFEYKDMNAGRRGLKLGNTLRANQREQLFATDLETPARPNGIYDNYNVSASRQDLREEKIDSYRLGFSRTRPMGTFIRTFSTRYAYQTRTLPGEEPGIVRSLTPVVSWTARETDHLLYPSSGYMLKFRTGGALEGFFSDAGFFHMYAKGKYYHPVGEKNTIIARTEAGHVFAGKSPRIPSEFLFRTGGLGSIRGYRYLSLGVEDRGAVVGGRYLLASSLEYNRHFLNRWTFAVFADGGNAHDDWSSFNPVFGAGIGIRLRTAVGPVNLDAAYGGAHRGVRLHFSLAITFR